VQLEMNLENPKHMAYLQNQTTNVLVSKANLD